MVARYVMMAASMVASPLTTSEEIRTFRNTFDTLMGGRQNADDAIAEFVAFVKQRRKEHE